jgi:hypothetical protein
MQVPTADPGPKDDLQVKCDKLEERLKFVELKSIREAGVLQTTQREHGNLKITYNELQDAHRGLKEAHEGLKEAHEGLKAATVVCGV